MTAKDAVVDSAGAYDRETAWSNLFKDAAGLEYENINSNLQSWKRGPNITQIGGVKEEEIEYQDRRNICKKNKDRNNIKPEFLCGK